MDKVTDGQINYAVRFWCSRLIFRDGEQMFLFERTLHNQLVEMDRTCTIQVVADWGPLGALLEAAEVARVPHSCFPSKKIVIFLRPNGRIHVEEE